MVQVGLDQRHQRHPFARCAHAAGNPEGHQSAERIASEVVRSLRLDFSDCGKIRLDHFVDRGMGLEFGVRAACLDRDDRAFGREPRCQRHQLQDIAEDAMHDEQRIADACPQRYEGGMLTFSLPSEITADLKRSAASLGATFYALLLAAFKALLHRYSGQNDMVIGGVVDKRSRPELSQTIGYFLNGVALRSRPRPDMTFAAYVAEIQRMVLDAVDAAAAPFERVVRMVRPHRDRAAAIRVARSAPP